MSEGTLKQIVAWMRDHTLPPDFLHRGIGLEVHIDDSLGRAVVLTRRSIHLSQAEFIELQERWA